ncbi:OB-fold domain-containing protein [Alkaliphilus pronyensis]|uniref:OB-fold domain-containing protein n=1 Tax=Alkaliphilus pronyensis TaxID=1482732 RepID=A0A6I0F8Y3_9FIRM|nr:OB-fold domain-containing protein [Alkaliphilus pronyensis]KAB3532146.1 OB-fold domain-containing protein [Alkaliphilus pronyensis]
MNKKATIYTYSIIYTASEDFKDQTPYVIAIVEDKDSRVLSRIEGYEENKEIHIGMEVELFKTDESGNPIYKFIN